MKYFFVFEKSQEGIPTLIVYRDNGSLMFGGTPEITNVFTGKRAEELYYELSRQAKAKGAEE